MDFIIMIVVGFIVGLIARAIMPGKQDMGIIMTAILGIVGSVVGGFLARSLGLLSAGQAAGWIASIIGAIVVLFIYGLVTKNK